MDLLLRFAFLRPGCPGFCRARAFAGFRRAGRAVARFRGACGASGASGAFVGYGDRGRGRLLPLRRFCSGRRILPGDRLYTIYRFFRSFSFAIGFFSCA